MRWSKKGRIFVPDGSARWARTHAFPPTPVRRPDGTLRIFVACCDDDMVGRVGWVDVDPDDPSRVLGVAQEPVFGPGQPGAFDEHGVVPTRLLEAGDELWMYYVGFQRGARLPYFQFQGLAISADGGASFRRARRVPIIDRSDTELVNRTSAFVRHAAGGGFEMWYVGGSEWTEVDGKPLPVYDLRHVRSDDGVHWPQSGEVCLELSGGDEHALGRPWVVERPGGVQWMFYSSRTRSKDYRIGYAESQDGVTWTRRDEDVGIDVSPEGWDSESLAYAAVVDHGERTYMFHCGNLRGRTGFGWAELER